MTLEVRAGTPRLGSAVKGFRRALRSVRSRDGNPEHVLCSASAVAGGRKAGYAVIVWTVGDPAHLRELAAWGIDGVFANDPAAAAQALLTRA